MLVKVEGSERVNCAPVDEAIWSAHLGVVVPIPTRRAALGEIARESTVEVAHLELIVSVPELPPIQVVPIA